MDLPDLKKTQVSQKIRVNASKWIQNKVGAAFANKHWFLTIAIVFIGISIRLRLYLIDRSMWLDEAFLVLSIRNKTFLELLTTPLDYGQSAPPGFLIISRCLVVLFGSSDLVLRAWPFITGIALLLLSVSVANRMLVSFPSRLLMVSLTALSPVLIYYSQEAKQYSSDAFFTMLVLFLWTIRDKEHGKALIAIAGLITALMSLTGLLLLFALGIALLLHTLRNRIEDTWDFREILSWGPVVIFWGIGAFLHIEYLAASGVDRTYMADWWTSRGGFPPESLSNIGDLSWYPISVFKLFWLGLGNPDRADPGMSTGPLILSLLVFICIYYAIKYRHKDILLPLLILTGTFLLAEFRLYPFSSRLIIFLLPCVFILIAAGLDSFWAEKRIEHRFFSLLAVLILIIQQSVVSFPLLLSPLNDRDMKWALAQVQTNALPNDSMILNSWSKTIFLWYRDSEYSSSIADKNLHWVSNDPDQILSVINSSSSDRFWIVSTHRSHELLNLLKINKDKIILTELYYDRGTLLALIVPP